MISYEPSTNQKDMSAVRHRRFACIGLGKRSKTRSRLRSYDICYLSADDRLICKLVVQCRNSTCAKVMAHAMKLPKYKHIEIWRGDTNIYSRPLRYQSTAR